MAAPPQMPAGLHESESDVDMSPGLVSTKQAKVIAVFSCAIQLSTFDHSLNT